MDLTTEQIEEWRKDLNSQIRPEMEDQWNTLCDMALRTLAAEAKLEAANVVIRGAENTAQRANDLRVKAEAELKHRCACRFSAGGALKKELCEFHKRLNDSARAARRGGS